MIRTDEKSEIKYIDPSSLSTFTRCPARYYFSRVLGLSLPGSNKAAPDFGTCIHLALPHCYERETLPTGIQIFKDAWSDMGYDDSDKKHNTQKAEQMLTEFCLSRCGSKCPYQRLSLPQIAAPEGVSKVDDHEVPYLIDIGAELPFAGRIDLVVRWKIDGKIYPCDYKTTSEMSDRLTNSFWNAPQTLGYTLALWHLVGERPPGLALEMISKTKETQVAFYPVEVEDHLLENFVDWAGLQARSILECRDKGEWPQNPIGCSSYAAFGIPTFTCEYQMLCNVPDWHTVDSVYQKSEPYHPFSVE